MPSHRRPASILLPILVIGLMMRALIPAGYMPGSADGGPWFVLCPDSLPMSMNMAHRDSGHHHHHHDHKDSPESALSGDCSFAHLLAGAIVATDTEPHPVPRFDAVPSIAASSGIIPRLRIENPTTRAPPVAS
ncbi:MAG: hypothetical protein QNJ19_15945 [Woeseiaceae bacterium]|nr:hypothetical protein [Woeseiaceae bacterium]